MYFKFEGRINNATGYRHLWKGRNGSAYIHIAIRVYTIFAELAKNCRCCKRKILPSVHINYADHNDF